MTYDNPLTISYQLNAATLSSAAELATFAGPNGMTGRVSSIVVLVTTAVTVAAANVSVNLLDNSVVCGTLEVAVGAADTIANDATVGGDDTLITADTAFTIDTDGGCTAGAGNIIVTVDWF